MSKEKMRICMSSQTPLVRFNLSYDELIEKYGDLPEPLPLESLNEGEDYDFAPGGVPKMVYPLMREMISAGVVEKADWVSLSPDAPPRISAGNVMIHNITMSASELGAYSRFKEKIWNDVHDLGALNIGPREFAAYAKYNWLCAQRMFELFPIDVFYVHDFQQLQIGAMLGLSAPVIFRWHIPFNLDHIKPYTRGFMLRCMESFDSIVVSCRRDLEGLIRSGYRGKAHQIYPYVDQRQWTAPSAAEQQEFCSRFGIKDGEKVVLVVGRMDRIKGQDVAIRAFAKIAEKFPKAKLVLVGNGSFSGSKKGGLGHSKSDLWRAHLQKLASDMKISSQIVFTGYLTDNEMRSAYSRCDAFVLPSITEGFGLVVIEAWLYKKPVIVSTGAGASELIIDDVNGNTFQPGNAGELATKMERILADGERNVQMGERGFESSRQCYVENGVKQVSQVLREAIENFERV